jgi:thiol-disulfide isomerase/thioredoxin
MMSGIVAILVVAFVLHAALTFALLRRVHALQGLVVGAPEPLPSPGTAIGSFEAVTTRGEVVTDASLRAAPVLIGFFSPGCKPCEQARAALLARPPALPLVAFVAGAESDAAARALADELARIARVAYTTPADPVNRAFRPTLFPSLFRIEDGVIARAGHEVGDVLA